MEELIPFLWIGIAFMVAVFFSYLLFAMATFFREAADTVAKSRETLDQATVAFENMNHTFEEANHAVEKVNHVIDEVESKVLQPVRQIGSILSVASAFVSKFSDSNK